MTDSDKRKGLPCVGAIIIGEDGLRAEVEQVLEDGGRVVARFSSGRRILLSRSALEAQDDGFRTAVAMADVASADDGVRSDQPVGSKVRILPVIEERVHIGKRTVDRGSVRVSKTVSEELRDVEYDLSRSDFSVERVPLGSVITDASPAPEARWEGDTFIMPILEEVLVVEKRLILREEVRLKRTTASRTETQQVKLRREDVTVERLPGKKPNAATNP